MSTYGGRRGPNVSQYLRHLNTIPAEPTQDDGLLTGDIDDVFTNTEFFDFESGQTTDFQPAPVKPDAEQISRAGADDTSPVGDITGFEFISDFNFTEYPPYQASAIPASYSDSLSLQPLPPSAPVYTTSVSQQQQQQHAPFHQHRQVAGEKRSADAMTAPDSQLGYDESARIAAEEDKRRRNTAASARFRVKKKQREQALERTAKEMSEKVTALEGRIQQLETENKWLKNMILEKNGSGDQITSSLEKEPSSKELKVPETIKS